MPFYITFHDASSSSSVFVHVGSSRSTQPRPNLASSCDVALRAHTDTKRYDAMRYSAKQIPGARRADEKRLDKLRARENVLYHQNTFLHWLPVEVLLSLFRGTSLRPRSRHWEKYLDVETTLSVCHFGGGLGDAARRSVPALFVSDCRREPHLHCGIGAHDAKFDPRAIEFHVRNGNGLRMFQELIQQVGPELQSLAVHFSYFWARGIHFEEHCRNLTSLALYDRCTEFDLPAVLEACSGKMLSLEIGAAFLPERYISAITEHCPKLEELILKCGEIGASLLPMWKKVGSTLTELTLGRPGPVGRFEYREITFLNYEDIAKYCIALRTFGIANIGFGTVPISAIKAFGERLQTLRMKGGRSCLPPEKLSMILEDRSNLKVEASVESNCVATLQAANSRLTSLQLKMDEFEDGIEEAARECTNLEEIHFMVRPEFADYLLLAFLTSEMKHLRRLNIEVQGYYGLEKEKNLLDLLSARLTTIEELSCHVNYISVGVFSLFAAKNENIRSVKAVCGRSARCTVGDIRDNSLRQSHHIMQIEEVAVSFVESFVKCEFLEELILEDELLFNKKSHRIQNVINACKIRNGAVDVFVGGVQYSS